MSNNLLVFTDLDGTLLDHYTYSSDAAKQTLAKLKTLRIPVIPNTSKTKAELTHIRQDLALDTPFIIENGAAVYIPVGYFSQQPPDTHQMGDYWVKSFCHERIHWLNLLSQHTYQFKGAFKGFSQLSEHELEQLTGLSLSKVKQAKERAYSEPLHWLADEETKYRFIDYMSDLGAQVLKGGRFLHVSGFCDKGQAQLWLAEQYHQQNLVFDDFIVIALGDSDNDIAMLEAANVAIQIRSPVHKFPSLQRQHQVFQSTKYGPKGWAECIEQFIK